MAGDNLNKDKNQNWLADRGIKSGNHAPLGGGKKHSTEMMDRWQASGKPDDRMIRSSSPASSTPGPLIVIHTSEGTSHLVRYGLDELVNAHLLLPRL